MTEYPKVASSEPSREILISQVKGSLLPGAEIGGADSDWRAGLLLSLSLGKFDRRAFLQVGSLAAAGVALPKWSQQEARPSKEGEANIGEATINRKVYALYGLTTEPTNSRRQVVPQKPGFVFWPISLPAVSVLYAEWRYSGQDLAAFLQPDSVDPGMSINLKAALPSGVVQSELVFERTFGLNVFGERDTEPTRIPLGQDKGWVAYQIFLEGGKPKRAEDGLVVIGRPVRALSEVDLVSDPRIKNSPRGSYFGMTCFRGSKVAVGIFEAGSEGVNLQQPVTTLGLPWQYLLVKFNPV